MRGLVFTIVAAVVLGLGFWAYRENYRTQDSLGQVVTLQAEIASLRERQMVLSAEWAYLNRPDRLRELADLNFERLALMPLRPEQFGNVENATYPTPMLPVSLDSAVDPVDVVGTLPGDTP